MFHKEGRQIILVATLGLFGLIFLIYQYTSPVFFIMIGTLLVLFYAFILYFFRNPKRVTVSNEGDIIAAVDGKVVVIEETVESEYFKDKRIQVSIFMSPLNVHVTRYPLSGLIKYTKYHPGKFLVAWHPKSSTENERTTVVVDKGGKEVLFRQIAGALARRIVLYSKQDEQVKVGDDFGFIKFGSRVDIFLPLDTEIEVKLHQKTKGGITRIAKLK
ncbi:phosphatidylserine decarboxylase [Flavobacteriaceae bacterium UJ101]|nr:phosphatidylserine decarboxylase [Flavobacteriaceae bacterium UJ101]